MNIINRVAKVDQSKCVGCKSCERVCPTQAIRVKPAEPGKMYVSPCRNACPAGIDVPGYIALAGAGRYVDAYRLIRKNNPFPSVCGRVCTHECQQACNRGCFDEPLAIRDIKRFVSDETYKKYNGFPKENIWDKNGKKVAIIGAGPSGLSCGYYLALSGYEVDVFEQESEAGGVLLYGIPQYRLPKDILARDIKGITDVGVKIHLNQKIGETVDFDKLYQDYDAVYIATGTSFSRFANIPGEDLPGVYHGLDFLRDNSRGKVQKIGKRVVVIGGGNTAMDVSRTLIRMGAEDVTILYRRRRSDMPAEVREVTETLEEGVKLVSMSAPVKITGNGKVEKIECVKMQVGEKDERGRAKTTPIEGSEFEIPADTVIMAVSQYSDFPFIDKDEVQMTEFGKLVLDENQMTTKPGVFAGGDVSRGSATAIQAIADGKMAAVNINDYCGVSARINDGGDIELPEMKPFNWETASSEKSANLPIAERIHNNREVALGLTAEQVKEEAKRCYRCSGTAQVDESICLDCGRCWEVCSHLAIRMEPLPEQKRMQYPLPGPDRIDQVLDLCKKAHMYPFDIVCGCTQTQAEEICNALLDGAETYEDLSKMTGVRGGCGCNCSNQLTRLLTAAGHPPVPRPDGNCYPITVDLWSLPKEAVDFDPKLKIEETQKMMFSDEMFEQVSAMYRQMVEGRAQKNGDEHEN